MGRTIGRTGASKYAEEGGKVVAMTKECITLDTGTDRLTVF
jgi:hypothetical protein